MAPNDYIHDPSQDLFSGATSLGFIKSIEKAHPLSRSHPFGIMYHKPFQEPLFISPNLEKMETNQSP